MWGASAQPAAAPTDPAASGHGSPRMPSTQPVKRWLESPPRVRPAFVLDTKLPLTLSSAPAMGLHGKPKPWACPTQPASIPPVARAVHQPARWTGWAGSGAVTDRNTFIAYPSSFLFWLVMFQTPNIFCKISASRQWGLPAARGRQVPRAGGSRLQPHRPTFTLFRFPPLTWMTWRADWAISKPSGFLAFPMPGGDTAVDRSSSVSLVGSREKDPLSPVHQRYYEMEISY